MLRILGTFTLTLACCFSAAAGQEGARLYNLKVISDTVPDVSSAEALLAQIITPGMTDEQKATAVWRVMYEGRFWNPSSRGNLRMELGGTDPIITLNCFSPTICQQDAEILIALWEMLGYSARMWQLGWHTTSEIYYGGKWRHFDATVGRITRDADGEIGSVTLGRKHKGWKNWMRSNSYISEAEGISLGHRMGLTLREGESFTRYWYPLGKTADYWCASSDGRRPDNRVRRRRRLAKAMKLKERRFKPMPDDAAYGNGLWVFEPDLAGKNWRRLLEGSQNLTATVNEEGHAWVHPIAAGKEAWATFRIKSPYILSGGYVSGTFGTTNKSDQLEVLASVDQGRNWHSLWQRKLYSGNPLKGRKGRTLGLRELISGKFDCLIKIRMLTAGEPSDVGFAGIRLESFVMNNPFLLPALKLGKTKISVETGPQLDSLSILPNMAMPEYRTQIVDEKNTITSWEADLPGWQMGLCSKTPGKESYVTFKVTTPGEMKKLRWGGRFIDDNETTKLFYSFDGKKWTEKPWTYKQRVKDTANDKREQVALYEVLDKFPPGCKEVWLKYWFMRPAAAGTKPELLLTPGIRIDADYLPQVRAKRPPMVVTYCWTQYEGDKETEKTHRKVIEKYPSQYGIVVKGDREPAMKWVKVELKSDPPPATTKPK